MKGISKKIFTTFLTSFLILNLYAQKGYDLDEGYKAYDFNNFKGGEFFLAAIICGILLAFGQKLSNQPKGTLSRFLGGVLLILGVIGAIIFLVGPIMGIIEILWKVLIGIAVIIGIFYFIQKITN